MRYDETPNERIVDRAVELWKRALREPKYENTRPGEGDFGNFLAMSLADMLPKNNTPEVLDAFGAALKKRLMTPSERGYYESWLSVDYHPCPILSGAAGDAGLKMEFPYKTNMSLERDYLSFRVGYGGKTLYHHPMDGGRWLVTSLYGDEISKVIEYINGGKPSFTVEAAPVPSPTEQS